MLDTAIVVMASWGDVIISTILTKAIKEQKPDWHITYYTSSACAGAIENNPHVDDLRIIKATKDQAWAIQDQVIATARREHKKVITPWAGWYPQHEWVPLQWPDKHNANFMWAYVRSAQLEGLEVLPNQRLTLATTDEEREKANLFTRNLDRTRKTVLMEVEGHSSQSWLNQSWIKPILTVLNETYGEPVNLLISKGGEETNEIMAAKQAFPGQITLLNNYTLREVAHIFNSCDIFIGCSSGTSNACHASICKTNAQWFEAVKSTIWDSSPLRPLSKHIYYGEEPSGFFSLLRNNLK